MNEASIDEIVTGNISQYQFPCDIEIMNLGDVHRGEDNCDVDLLYRALNYVERTPNCYWVSTGDMCNIGIASSVSGAYGSMTVDKELDAVASEFAPIADKCLGFVKSNHHSRIERTIGMSFDRVMAEKLNVPFLGAFGYLNITCGRTSYFTVMHHGVGGGRQRGGKVNNLVRLGDIIPCADLYLEGHTHNYSALPEGYRYIDRKRNRLCVGKSWFVCTAHCLKYEGSYGEDHKYKPATSGFALIKLKASGTGKQHNKKIKPELFEG